MQEKFYISSTKYALQERQTKKHGRVYDVVFRIVTMGGIEKQKKLSGYTTKTLAKEAYTDFVTKYCELVKNNPLKKKNLQKAVPTVDELVKEYMLALRNQNKDTTIYDKTLLLNLYVLPKFENKKITDLTKETLQSWQEETWRMINPKTNDYYSYNYLCKIREHFSGFLSWCEDKYEYKNFFNAIKKPKRRVPKTEMQIWTKDEFERFISVVDDETYHCLFMMMFYTGRRKGEIFALTPEDIKGKTIKWNKSLTKKTLDGSPYKITSTKAEKIQTLPICDTLYEELKAYKAETPFFFGGAVPLPATTVTRKFEQYCKKADIKRIRIHDLRHSFVSMCIHLGAPLTVVADLIGDTLEQVTKTYGHLYTSDRDAIISKIG